MSKFDRLAKGKPAKNVEEKPFVVVEGTFICQRCQEFVDDAKFYTLEHLLVWRCPENHTSFIEDMTL